MTDKELAALYNNSAELTPSPELKAKILVCTSAEMEKKKASAQKKSLYYIKKKWIPITACLALVFLLIGGMLALNYESYQIVYLDINPSVALHVNRFERVSKVECLNDDARDALKGVKFTGRSAEDALEIMLTAYADAGYFDETAEIYINTVCEKNNNADVLLEKLCDRAEKVRGTRKYAVNTSELTPEDEVEAAEYAISPGKYRVISEIIEEHPELTVDDLKDKSMAELREMQGKGKAEGKGKHG